MGIPGINCWPFNNSIIPIAELKVRDGDKEAMMVIAKAKDGTILADLDSQRISESDTLYQLKLVGKKVRIFGGGKWVRPYWWAPGGSCNPLNWNVFLNIKNDNAEVIKADPDVGLFMKAVETTIEDLVDQEGDDWEIPL